MTQTLFRKDSVLFISMDGKGYEVSNPMDTGFSVVIGDTIESFLDRFIKPGEKIEWPGEVELITIAPHPECNKARECLQLTDGLNCSQAYDARIRDTSLCAKAYKVARLLPKEKTEHDQQQFEAHLPCVSAKKEPNLERLAGKLKPNYNHAQRIKRVESSEPLTKAQKQEILDRIGAKAEPVEKMFDSLRDMTMGILEVNNKMLSTIADLESDNKLLRERLAEKDNNIDGLLMEIERLKAKVIVTIEEIPGKIDV